jgi:Na+-transporting NADH:ubiquinone oxidoreductase subunit NqrB
MNAPAAPSRVIIPRRGDPRITIAVALSAYTILGQTVLYFNRDLAQIAAAIVSACVADMILTWITARIIVLPLSAYITGLSVGILLESYDVRVFIWASLWGIASKHLLRGARGHFFNPSNFSIVAALLLGHGLASVAPGSQWGGVAWIAAVILVLGLVMMYRVNRLDLVGAWLSGYIAMGALRLWLGQGGIVFVLGPMTGAEFALFSFSMLPDPKASPATRRARILWGLGLAVTDGVLRYFEVRYSMFYALFAFCAALPFIDRSAGRRAEATVTPATN